MWRPERPQALVVGLHGFGEHGGRYEALGQALAQRGVCVAVPDLWGHGRSQGRRGDIPSPAGLIRQLQELTAVVFLSAAGQASYALFGHSFGGLLAIQWALDHPAPLGSVVLQSPWLDTGFPIPRWKTALALGLAGWWPSVGVPLGLPVDALSRDPAVQAAYRADPLVHRWITVRTYQAIRAMQEEAPAQVDVFTTPLLLILGAEDRIISVAAAERWFARLGGERQAVMFPGCFHEVHHEGEAARARVAELIRDWVLPHA
jgi:alpha-beta hydrolase superfamily lysophospholipase